MKQHIKPVPCRLLQVSKVTIHMEAATIDHSVTPACVLPRLIEVTGPRWTCAKIILDDLRCTAPSSAMSTNSYLGNPQSSLALTPFLFFPFPPISFVPSAFLLRFVRFFSTSSSRVSVTIAQFCFDIRRVVDRACQQPPFLHG